MTERVIVRRGSYHDSARLMRIARELSQIDGVVSADVMMGTAANLELLASAGFPHADLDAAGPLDLVAALRSDDTGFDAARQQLALLLAGTRPEPGHVRSAARPASVAEAVREHPNVNLVSIAVPGAYAAFVAHRALDAGRHVFLFSDNVALSDEVALKARGREAGLLVMGPDCGTAIIDGVGLGFANRVPRGPVGIVGASGTGTQEVCCLLSRLGVGVSHAIGTGSRDLSADVHAVMSTFALRLLADDDRTRAIVLVAKHPAPAVADMLHGVLAGLGKPAVVRYLGEAARPSADGVIYAETLDDAARFAAAAAGAGDPRGGVMDLRSAGLQSGEPARGGREREMWAPAPVGAPALASGRLVGLFGGGSLAAEARHVLATRGIDTTVPARPLVPGQPIPGTEHLIIDTGDDAYTVGRPHPMVDQAVRCGLIRTAGADRTVGILLLDLVLGDGSHPNPAPEIAAAVGDAREARGGQPLAVVCSVCGSADDPQDTERQAAALGAAGIHTAPTAAEAARLAATLLGHGRDRRDAGPAAVGRASRPPTRRDRPDAACSRVGVSAAGVLAGPVEVVHFGLDSVASAVEAAGARVTRADFIPPAGGDPERIALLASVLAPPLGKATDEANGRALERMLASRPHLVGVGIARDVVPGMADNLFLHAGPPIEWTRMCGPLRGAVIGGVLLEGLAGDAAEAERMAASGALRFDPCHHHQTVGPMAGVVTPSMPVWIVEDQDGPGKGTRTFCTLNEGLGKVLRYGAYSAEVIRRLRFMADEVAPVLADAIAGHGPVDIRLMMAQALHMGDEGHNRNRAATSLLVRELAAAIVRSAERERAARTIEFIKGNDHFFLNLSMPLAKCMLLAAEGEPHSSLLTVMARNGTDFGIRVSSMPGRWFVGPAQMVNGLYFPGYSAADANPDIGDSAITETAGIGGFAMAAAPAIVQFVGGDASDALATTERMARITAGRHDAWTIPALGFAGTPVGIDIRKVEELNVLPTINTGIAHRTAGVGQVGAGLVNPPWDCFHAALAAFAEQICEPARGATRSAPRAEKELP